jgi:2,4-dienoyl-CoA reductase-like NADH-dependent reductase (Old Yellow Enzyme family)
MVRKNMSTLFSSFTLRELTLKSRIIVSPMCQYSSENGMPTDWHLVHLGSRAVGGAAMVFVEATAVSPEGRISPDDSGIWSDAHAEAFKRIATFIKSQNAVPAMQLAHAGRKASTDVPWRGGRFLTAGEGGWQTIAPSPIPFRETDGIPREMTREDIEQVTAQFADATRRSVEAGFETVEIHMAHGYLLHEFLSPLSNKRTDVYGGSLESRARFPLQVARAVRAAFPSGLPVFARLSVTDWAEGGWDLAQSIQFSRWLKDAGIDLIDCSSGGLVPGAKIPIAPGYQVPFAAAIREEVEIATGAVGLITEAKQAEEIVSKGEADLVFLARAMLRDPYWAIHAARELHVDVAYPSQYARAWD